MSQKGGVVDMVDQTQFLHDLSVNLAHIAKGQLDLAELSPSYENINHLGEAFSQVLKEILAWKNEPF